MCILTSSPISTKYIHFWIKKTKAATAFMPYSMYMRMYVSTDITVGLLLVLTYVPPAGFAYYNCISLLL